MSTKISKIVQATEMKKSWFLVVVKGSTVAMVVFYLLPFPFFQTFSS